jgi:glycosyltransferase 2 family protein
VGEAPVTDRPASADAGHVPVASTIGRHPRDLVVLFLTAGVVTLCALAARSPGVNPVEVAIYGQFGQIPAASTVVWRALSYLGGWVGIAAVGAVLLYLKRIRLGLQAAAAGAAAWVAVQGLNELVGPRALPMNLLTDVGGRPPGPDGFVFPATHAAVAAAMVALAAPFLKFRYQVLAWTVAVLVAASDMYLGYNLPLGAFAGVMLGRGIGALGHLVFGAPGRRTSEVAVWRALAGAGLRPASLIAVREHRSGPLAYLVTTGNERCLRVEVVRRLHRRAGPWYRLRRLLASLEVEDEPPLTSTNHEVEHEALVTLFAQRAGLRTPSVVLTCETRHGVPLLVRQQVEGQRLTELPRDQISDALLDAIWDQVAILGKARIAHHDLRAKNILVDRDGRPWLLGLTFGKIGASPARIAQDIAEALFSLASRVGVERTVHAACRVLPPDRLEPALAYLQPLALPRRIRKQSRERFMLTALRETLAERIDRPIPTFRSPVRATSVVGLVLLGAAVYTLLPQLSSLRAVLDSLGRASWPWLVVTALTGFLAVPLSALSVMGSSPTPLPFWRTTAVQLAACFTGRTTPGGVGFFGINIAFIERLGVRRSSAVGVVLLNLAAAGVVGGVLAVVGVFAVGASGLLTGLRIPHSQPVLLAAAAVVAASVAVLASPFGRRRFVRPGLEVTRELLGALRHPVRALLLLGGTVGTLVASGLGLATSLAAFGAQVPVVAVVTVFLIGQVLGHIAPIPGGLGPVEALMVAGLTALSTEPTVAVAAVLAARLLTYWLPVLPGIAMFRYLQHHDYI